MAKKYTFNEFYGREPKRFEFNESEHPRAGDGKFTDGDGDSGQKEESEIDRLMRWRAENNGKPDAGQARQLIKSYSTGHATLEQVQAAIDKYEALAAKREKRHSRQGWVSPGQRVNLEDGKVYQNIHVWSPGTGGRNITARFMVKPPRGKALMDVMVRYPEMDYSEKIGSFVAVEPEKMDRTTFADFYGPKRFEFSEADHPRDDSGKFSDGNDQPVTISYNSRYGQYSFNAGIEDALRKLTGEVDSDAWAHAVGQAHKAKTVITVAELAGQIKAAQEQLERARAKKGIRQVKCDCGHTVSSNLVMSASHGTACPDCYDQMSD